MFVNGKALLMAKIEVSLFMPLAATTLQHYNLDLFLKYAGSAERSPKVIMCYFDTTFVARHLNNAGAHDRYRALER
jgi:hypothetical protein